MTLNENFKKILHSLLLDVNNQELWHELKPLIKSTGKNLIVIPVNKDANFDFEIRSDVTILGYQNTLAILKKETSIGINTQAFGDIGYAASMLHYVKDHPHDKSYILEDRYVKYPIEQTDKDIRIKILTNLLTLKYNLIQVAMYNI